MIVLKVEIEQLQEFTGIYKGVELKPIPYEDFFWLPISVKTDKVFISIRKKLKQLEEIEIDL